MAETLRQAYSDVMRVPWSRRKRLAEKKMILERKREKASSQAAKVSARRARRSR